MRIGGGQEIGMGRAELGRDLLGEEHRHSQQPRGFDRQPATAQADLAFGHGLEEGRLDVHDEQGDAGGGGFGHARQTARKGQ